MPYAYRKQWALVRSRHGLFENQKKMKRSLITVRFIRCHMNREITSRGQRPVYELTVNILTGELRSVFVTISQHKILSY